MNNALILTLGHGASAILVIDGVIVNGYQLERITGIKGDSRFPSLCIEEIEKFNYIPENVQIYVSHWHPSGDVEDMIRKHWNRGYLKAKFPLCTIQSTNTHTTHHDTHAYSATAYNHMMKEGEHILVADGFGTLGEVLSLYEYNGKRPVLKKRLFGLDGSLGLLYQYATDFVGWKQNQDEWKLNACANIVPPSRQTEITALAYKYCDKLLDIQSNRDPARPGCPITNLGAISYTHAYVVELLQSMFSPSDKAGIAYFLQKVVEDNIKFWLHGYHVKKCTFVGGCFMNVQLNGALANVLDEICVMPLSGDEGAGLGIYKYFNPEFIIPDDLCWGKRDLDVKVSNQLVETDDVVATVSDLLSRDFIVNVVRSTMEFGPRAYCNTSTLAKPTLENHQYINRINHRTTVMPMCPVMTWSQYEDMCDRPTNIRRSVEHMIIALPINELSHGAYPGVQYTTAEGLVTCRPQVVDSDSWIHPILQGTGPLINTSFNNHGNPIVYTMDQILKAHKFMVAKDSDLRVVTVIDKSELAQTRSEEQVTGP